MSFFARLVLIINAACHLDQVSGMFEQFLKQYSFKLFHKYVAAFTKMYGSIFLVLLKRSAKFKKHGVTGSRQIFDETLSAWFLVD